MISHKHLALDLLPQRQERKAERKRLRERAEAWSIACYCVLLWVKYVFLVIPVFVFQGFVVFSNMLSWFDGVFLFFWGLDLRIEIEQMSDSSLGWVSY